MAELYQPDKFEDVKIGEKTETEVLEITEGKQEDFRTEEYWTTILAKDNAPSKEEVETMRKKTAIQITTVNGATLVINLPANNIVNPKSNFALWKNTYNKYPAEGQKVTTKTDDNGFQRIVLEK